MQQILLKFMRCPLSGLALKVEPENIASDVIQEGWLVSVDGKYRYPITNGIPRFVASSNYADNFGMQWNHFRKTQLDSYSGHAISAERFWKSTGWCQAELQGKLVLDVGCGAGRFAEIALLAGAEVVAIDYSSAVDACYANLSDYKNLHVVQANIYELPFLHSSFDYIYSLGVLQHTPNVRKSFLSLPAFLKPGGCICVDYYEKTWQSWLLPKYLFRPITKKLAKPILFNILQKTVPKMLKISILLGAIPLFGNWLKRIVPVLSYYNFLPLSKTQHIEWSLLDTFDMFAPEYDNPQSRQTVAAWMLESGLNNIEIFKLGHLVARGEK